MRIGIFSDTHANIEALEAVQRALTDDGVDKRVCLGDTVGYGASPNECCAIIRERAAHTILGNHDAAVAGPDGLLVLLPRGPPRAGPARAAADARQHAVAEGAALRGARGRRPLLPRLAAEHRGVRLHLRPRSGGAVPGHLGRPGAADADRPLAPVQVVRAVARRRARGGVRSSSSFARAGSTSSASARSASPATTTRAPATRCSTPTRSSSSSSASTTTSRRRPRRSSAPTSNRTSAIGCSSACSVRRRAAARLLLAALALTAPATAGGRPHRRSTTCIEDDAGPDAARLQGLGAFVGHGVGGGRAAGRHRPRHRGGPRPLPAAVAALPEPDAVGRSAGRRGAQAQGPLHDGAGERPADRRHPGAHQGRAARAARWRSSPGRSDEQWVILETEARRQGGRRPGRRELLRRREAAARRCRRTAWRSSATAAWATCAA